MAPSGRTLYVSNTAFTIRTFAVGVDGTLEERQSVVLNDPRDLEVTADGRYLYAVEMGGGGNVRGYEISEAGTLAELPNSPFQFSSSRPVYIEIASDGDQLFVLDLDRGIAVFDIDPLGDLELIDGSPVGVGGFAKPLEMTDDDRFLYVGLPFEQFIRGYTQGPSALPVELGGSPFVAERPSVLIAPAGLSVLYEVTRESRTIHPFAVESDGHLTHMGSSTTVVDGEGRVPNGVAFLRLLPANAHVDIRPGSCPNPLNVRSNGVLPVALVSDADLDVLEVDASSVRLEGVPPLRSSVGDVAAPFDGEPCDCHSSSSDGLTDLSLKFKTPEIVAALGEVQDGEERPLTLTGVLLDGTPFEASDCVRILAGGGGRPPAPLVSENSGSLELSLMWESSDSAYFLNYAVYRGTTPDFAPVSAQDFYGVTAETSFLDTQVGPGETWFYRVGVFDEPVIIETPEGTTTVEVFSGYSEASGLQVQTSAPAVGAVPAAVSLQPSRPNPISRTAQIVYTLPSRMTVRLSVYDVAGRLVDRLVESVEAPGEHSIQWDARELPSGTYFYRLEAGSAIRTERAILVR
jgi:hypothetical protein